MTRLRFDLIDKAQRFRNARWPRYVFIHINKTAGSSIERTLNLRFEHKTAMEKRVEIGEHRWNRAFKFSFVRNPWDKVYSHYKYRVATNQTGMRDRHIPFRDWVLRAYGECQLPYYDQPKMFMPQQRWLIDDDGALMVDFVGRFENLDADFRRICDHLRIQRELAHLKRSDAPNYCNYRDAYDLESRACIAERFSIDVDAFEYSF